MTAALPMGSNKITGMAEPTVSTDAATKNYVDTTTASFFSTGDVKLTIKTVADSGWLICNDLTIGPVGSVATYANANALALFTLLFNNINDTYSPLYTSGGVLTMRAAQTNASTAWAAGCSIYLTKMLGRALAISGSGGGLTARTLGQNLGAETITIVQNQLPNATLGLTGSLSISVNSSNTHVPQAASGVGGLLSAQGGATVNGVPYNSAGWAQLGSSGSVSLTAGNTTSINGGVAQQTTSIMPPVSFLNAMIKL